MTSTSSNDEQNNNNSIVNEQGFNSGTGMISISSAGSSFAAQSQQQQQPEHQQQQQFYAVPHQTQQQFYQHSNAPIGQPQQRIYTVQQHPNAGQVYTQHRSIQSPTQHFVQIHPQQQMFYHHQVQQGGHQMGGQSSHVQHFYDGHSHHPEEEILMEEGEASSMIVAETCTVETSSPSPDFANEHPPPQLTKQSYYGHGQQQPIVMATMAQPSIGSAGAGQPMQQAGAYYMRPVHRFSHQSSSQSGYIVMSTHSIHPGPHHQQIAQQQSRNGGQNPNLLHQTTAIGHIIRRTTPFEEEEEEEDDDEEDEDEEEEDEQQIGHQSSSSSNRLHTLSLPQINQTSTKGGYPPQQQKQPNVNVNEPRMTRAGRRKQIFETKSTKIGSGRKGSTEGGVVTQSDEAKILKKTLNVTTPKKDNSQPAKPLLDKGVVHIQAVQRVATPEGWRRMNDWLKGAIKTMDLAKLRQLMSQLIDADISVDLLRANDTPKMIKDLQKCADKDIANMATKMVTKWKQSVREGNSNNSEKQKQQKMMAKSGTGTSGTGTTAATTGKHLRRNSQSMDTDEGDDQSASSNTAQKGGSSAIQTRGRTSSITATSSAGDTAQQQIGTRANSFGSGGSSTTTSSTNADGSAGTAAVEKPKTTAKAKAKISRPRLTGLEGDDDTTSTTQSGKQAQTPLTKRLSATAKTSISPTTAISESPLTKIMAATAKFQAQQQPKRKPVDVMFSDGFMDSLSAADNVRPKKPKIIRRKLNPLPGNGGTSTAKNDLPGTSGSPAGAATSSLNSSGGGGNGSGRRVRFIDEVGRELVEVRHFEIEEGERINVTKLDKEQIKHFDSQQEKALLMNSGFGRRPGPGPAPTGPTVGVSGPFSSLTDPSLMPPGHGRHIFGMPMPPSQVGMPPPPPMRVPFGMMPGKGPPTAATMGAFNSGKYPYKLIPVDCKPVIEPGNKSVSKDIELERQKTTMSALILPTPLPISDLDEQEWKRHREESLNHMPKIIPLELITEIVEQKPNQVKMEPSSSIKREEAGQMGSGEPMEIVDDAKNAAVKAEVEKMEEDTPLSPARPQVRRMSSDGESDVEMADESIKKDEEDEEDREDLIASPEPEPLNSSREDSTDSIKEIPIDKVRTSTEEDDEEEEDLDIRDIQQTAQQQLEAQKSQSKLKLVPSSSTSLQEFLKNSSPQVLSLLKNLNTTLGSDVTAAKGQDGTKQELGTKSIETPMASSPIPVIGTIAGGAIPSPSIPPPPTHLYPHRPPVSGQFGSISMGTPPRGLPPHIQQMMIRASPGGPIPFPPPNFSTPPPPIGQRPPFTMSATSVQFPLGQNVPPAGPQQTSQKVSPIPPIGLMQMPQISSQQPKMTAQSQDETKNKAEDSTTATSTSTITISSTSSVQQQSTKGGASPTSPGPPGLDEVGSPPPAPEQLAQNQQRDGQSPMVTAAGDNPTTGQQPQISPQTVGTPPQPVMSLQEARNVAGVCSYFMRFNKCNFGDQCKFAHDEQTMTKGVQMAMSGVSIGGGRGGMIRGSGPRGRGGNFMGSSGRSGNAFRPAGNDGGSGSGGGGFDDRRQRRGGNFGSAGGGGRDRDYDLSPIRDGGGNVGKGSGGGFRDRRFRQQSPRRRRGGYSSRSRSRERYSRRRRTRSRSRSRERSGRDRGGNRRRSPSTSKSSSSSVSTYSRSPSPVRDRNKESRLRGGRQSGSDNKRSNDGRMERNDPREGKKSSSPTRQQRQSAKSSSSSSSSTPNPEEDEQKHQQVEKNREIDGNDKNQDENDAQEEREQIKKSPKEAESEEVQIIE